MAQTDYLRFSAASMKEYITAQLTASGVYTDQQFEDSNLSTLIDGFSYMFSVMMFYLNNTGSEAIFADSQLYENMNRIVKMLGYNPAGFKTSTILTNLALISGSTLSTVGRASIPKYTTYTTGQTDTNGTAIKYSFIDNYPFVASSTTAIDSDFTPTLYNGVWTYYGTTFTTTGVQYETITLDALTMTGTDRIYIAHPYIDVYIKDPSGVFTLYSPVTSLYNSKATDTNFEVRINEKYQYTLKFGDNINGMMPTNGSTVYIVYLKSNGTTGQIGTNVMDGTVPLAVEIAGLSESFIKTNILQVDSNPDLIAFGTDANPELQKLSLTNSSSSTVVTDFESVEDVRVNAPNWFRTGGRLITKQDFEQYILANYGTEVYDVTCMNNWTYMTEFQQWLRSYGKLSIDIRYLNYKYADSCDFNNIYLWLKSYSLTNVSTATKNIVERDCDTLKPLTAEIIPCDPLIVTVVPYITGTYRLSTWDPNFENKIQLVRDSNTMISAEKIKQKAVSAIQTFFLLSKCELGMSLDINSLYNSLTAIDGVSSVRMKYLANGASTSTAQFYSGLSFAIWTSSLVDGADFMKISGNYKLKSFQFPVLYDSDNIGNYVEVLSDNYTVDNPEF